MNGKAIIVIERLLHRANDQLMKSKERSVLNEKRIASLLANLPPTVKDKNGILKVMKKKKSMKIISIQKISR